MRVIAGIMMFLSVVFSVSALNTAQTALDPNFKTLQVRQNGDPLGFPMYVMGTDSYLVFSFDEIAEDRNYLRYRVIHCNSDWQPSVLVDSEYLDGFNEAEIEDYEFSRTTTVHYVHYSVSIPNKDIRITHSGNYLLQVYNENDPEKVLLQFRFYVSEQSVNVSGNVKTVTDVDYNKKHQQLSFAVDCARSPVESVFSDLKVVVEQNQRQDNQVVLNHPMSVRGKTAVYEHLPALIFRGGNEYRRFETVSTQFLSLGVDDIEYRYPYYHFFLQPDKTRAYSQYLYDQTINGRFYIREYNSADSDTEADYVVAHFTLDAPYIPGRDIFIEGDITNRSLGQDAMMTYNSETGMYEKVMLLKQGQYNYQYLSKKKSEDNYRTEPLEGDFYQTVNQYIVRTYTRPRGEKADRLIGYSVLRAN